MKKSKSLFSQLYKKAILYGLVDEGGWFPQMLASRKTIAEYTKLTKNFLRNQRNLRPKEQCQSVKSVSNFLCALGSSWLKNGSIKNNKLCETKPIFRESELNLSCYITNCYGNKLPLLQMQKQSQINPTCGELVEPILPATTFGGQSQLFGFFIVSLSNLSL
jgi:hypothetical protein